MRIDRLDLIAFGPFTDVSLDLAAGAQGLHVVYGPNEAGKSSALRAIRQFFCGIPGQSADAFVHEYKKMSIGARLRRKDDTTLELVRRKGNKATLCRPDGTPADGGEAELSRALGGMSPDEFSRRFVLTRDELVAGGRESVACRGDLGPLLFGAGGGGLQRVGQVKDELEKGASDLFKPTGSKPRINELLGELAALDKRRREAELPSATWVEADRSLTAAVAQADALADELQHLRRDLARLDRLEQALVPASQRRDAREALTTLGPVPRLSDDFLTRYQAAIARLPGLEREADEARDRAAMLAAEVDAIDVPAALLDRADDVDALAQRRGALRQALDDRDDREVQLAQVEETLRDSLRELSLDVDASTALAAADRDDGPLASLRLSAARRDRLRALGEEGTARQRDRDAARKARDDAALDRRQLDRALDALGPDPDASPLRRALKQAQAAGDLDGARDKARQALRQAERKADAALKKLGRWSGPIEAAAALPIAAIEAIEACRTELEALDHQAETLDKDRHQLDRDAIEVEAKRRELALRGDVPSEAALDEARRRRDDAWQALAAPRAWDDARAAAFLDALRTADSLADRLRREADRVADAARLQADAARLDAGRLALDRDRDRLGARRADALARWHGLWAPLGLAGADVGNPRDMLAWHRSFVELARLADEAGARRAEAEAIDTQISSHLDALAAALAGLGVSCVEGESLADRRERAEEADRRLRDRATERTRLAKERAALDDAAPRLEQAAGEAEAAWADWQARWAGAVGPLGLGADASPAAAHAALERVDALFQRLDRRRDLRRAIAAAGQTAERFAADARALAAVVAPDLVVGAFDAQAVAAALADRIKAARLAEQERTVKIGRRDDALDLEQARRDEAARLRDALASLRREAGCDRDDDLPEVARRDQERRALETTLQRLDDELRRLAAGAALDAFLAELAAVDPDALGPERRRLDEQIQRLEDEQRVVNQAIGAGRQELAAMKGGSDAADLRQQEEVLRARIRAEVEEFARLKLAAHILKEGMDRYSKKAGGPVLDRAGAIFARLTLGSFAGLKVDYDGDHRVVRAVRPDGSDVAIDPGLSLGTADQLYLALRLATLEATLDRSDEPLPLIVDDVLVQFDDARAAATLAALADVSRRAQVLLFTHHEHLVRLALDRLPADTAFVHRLPARAAAATTTG